MKRFYRELCNSADWLQLRPLIMIPALITICTAWMRLAFWIGERLAILFGWPH